MIRQYRDQIDNIDNQIIELISKRLKLVRMTGEYKKKNNIPSLDMTRWQQVLKSKLELAKKHNINPQVIKDIYNRIHKEALKIENKAINI